MSDTNFLQVHDRLCALSQRKGNVCDCYLSEPIQGVVTRNYSAPILDDGESQKGVKIPMTAKATQSDVSSCAPSSNITARAYNLEHNNLWSVEILLWNEAETGARGLVLNEDCFTKSLAEELAKRITDGNKIPKSEVDEQSPYEKVHALKMHPTFLHLLAYPHEDGCQVRFTDEGEVDCTCWRKYLSPMLKLCETLVT